MKTILTIQPYTGLMNKTQESIQEAIKTAQKRVEDNLRDKDTWLYGLLLLDELLEIKG